MPAGALASTHRPLVNLRYARKIWHTDCRVPAGDTRQYFTFAECQLEALGKELTPSAPLTGGARRARVLGTCSGFAECRPASTRQRRHVAECLDLPTACTRQRPGMPCARFLPSVCGLALGKPHLCRVPVIWHSAKTETLGNYRFSSSGGTSATSLKTCSSSTPTTAARSPCQSASRFVTPNASR